MASINLMLQFFEIWDHLVISPEAKRREIIAQSENMIH